ncbi:MAG: hypothetical protein NTY34_03790 [Candidatus Omnitrophica bacterium]|nr:hypothetical protein [Candidatus Omnitrophota bacterium]
MISRPDRICCLLVMALALLLNGAASAGEETLVPVSFKEASSPRPEAPAPPKKPPEYLQETFIHVDAKGYYKNISAASRSMTNKKRYGSNLQRYRIEPTIDIGDNIQIYIACDNQVIAGDFVSNPDFDMVKQEDQKNLDWWDAEWTLVYSNRVYYTTEFYRAYLKYYDDKFQVIAGKQNIDWGRCRFYSPMDLFNPNSPLDIERDERVGVDAINATASITDFIDLDMVYVPYGALKKSSFAAKMLCRAGNYDIFLMTGQFKKDNVIGACIDGYLGGAGVRGEYTYTWQKTGGKFFRIVLGADYAFKNKLRMGGEYFFNGMAHDVNRDEFYASYQYSKEALTLEKNLVGATVGYDITPLIKWDNAILYDMGGRSLFINPELKYNMLPNLDITLGAQVFWGTGESEFVTYTNRYYLEVKYFF